MLDSFESPQEFCVVTEFAQVIQYPFTIWCKYILCISSKLKHVNNCKDNECERKIGCWLYFALLLQGELFEILEDDKCLPEEQVQAIAKQLVLLLHLELL